MGLTRKGRLFAFLASVLLNGGLCLAVTLQSPARQLILEPPAMVIELIGPDRGVAVPESLRSDTPEDDPSKAAATTAPTPPAPIPVRRAALPAADPIPWVQPEPRRETPKQPDAPVAAVSAPPPPSTGRASEAAPSATPMQPTRPAPRAGGTTNSPVALSGRQGDAYGARVRAHLEAHKIYPRGARRLRQTGVATISFVIDREGRVLTSRIVSSSGVATLDEEALTMLVRASPVPPPPPGVPGARIQMRTPVEFSLE